MAKYIDQFNILTDFSEVERDFYERKKKTLESWQQK